MQPEHDGEEPVVIINVDKINHCEGAVDLERYQDLGLVLNDDLHRWAIFSVVLTSELKYLTVLFIFPTWAVVNLITHQPGVDTETALTAELSKIWNSKVEIESSVIFS